LKLSFCIKEIETTKTNAKIHEEKQQSRHYIPSSEAQAQTPKRSKIVVVPFFG